MKRKSSQWVAESQNCMKEEPMCQPSPVFLVWHVTAMWLQGKNKES